MFIVYDIIRYARWHDPSFKWIVFPEAILIMPGSMVIMAAFASILGMQMSLRCRTTVLRGDEQRGNRRRRVRRWLPADRRSFPWRDSSGLVFASFSPFTVMALLIDPYHFGGRTFQQGTDAEAASARIIVFIFSWVAVAGYAAVVWAMYKSMVKNFDMTIRRQSR